MEKRVLPHEAMFKTALLDHLAKHELPNGCLRLRDNRVTFVASILANAVEIDTFKPYADRLNLNVQEMRNCVSTMCKRPLTPEAARFLLENLPEGLLNDERAEYFRNICTQGQPVETFGCMRAAGVCQCPEGPVLPDEYRRF